MPHSTSNGMLRNSRCWRRMASVRITTSAAQSPGGRMNSKSVSRNNRSNQQRPAHSRAGARPRRGSDGQQQHQVPPNSAGRMSSGTKLDQRSGQTPARQKHAGSSMFCCRARFSHRQPPMRLVPQGSIAAGPKNSASGASRLPGSSMRFVRVALRSTRRNSSRSIIRRQPHPQPAVGAQRNLPDQQARRKHTAIARRHDPVAGADERRRLPRNSSGGFMRVVARKNARCPEGWIVTGMRLEVSVSKHHAAAVSCPRPRSAPQARSRPSSPSHRRSRRARPRSAAPTAGTASRCRPAPRR